MCSNLGKKGLGHTRYQRRRDAGRVRSDHLLYRSHHKASIPSFIFSYLARSAVGQFCVFGASISSIAMAPDYDSIRARTSEFAGDVNRLTYETMIRVPEPTLNLVATCKPHCTTMGALDKLPVELIHAILYSLDLRSLSRLSQVSTGARVLVLSLPAYLDLLVHAPTAMAALGDTGYIEHCSLKKIHSTLCSDRCASCGSFGEFLFLPTCERCCRECLAQNSALWVTPRRLARKCFGLTPKQARLLTAMRCPPFGYWVDRQATRKIKGRPDLVSVKSAKLLALEVHGSDAKFPRWEVSLRICMSESEREESELKGYLRRIQGASLSQEDRYSILYDRLLASKDLFRGKASVMFPALINGKLDSGVLCLGCFWMIHNWFHMDKSDKLDVMEGLIYGTREWDDAGARLMYRAWSSNDFLDHVRTCHGVRQVIKGGFTIPRFHESTTCGKYD